MMKQKITVAVVGICRCDNHRIDEWFRWNNDIGVDKLILYDANDISGERPASRYWTASNIERGWLDLIDVRGKGLSEAEIFTDAYRRYGSSYTWLFFAGVGEFLQIPNRSTIQDTIGDRYRGFDLVHISRDIRTRTGIKEKPRLRKYGPSGRLVKYHPEREVLNRVCRSLVRGGLKGIEFIDGHTVAGNRRCCNAAGKTVRCGSFAVPSAVYRPIVVRAFPMWTLSEFVRINGVDDINAFFLYNPITEERVRWLKDNVGPECIATINEDKINSMLTQLSEEIDRSSVDQSILMQRAWLKMKKDNQLKYKQI